MSRVGEKIKEAREKSAITQKALSKKLGVSEKFINEVEMGKKVAPESFIEKASKILKIDFNEINIIDSDQEPDYDEKVEKKEKKSQAKVDTTGEISEVWTDAFSSVLKKVKIYDYKLKNVTGTVELANHSNKILGFPADKVLYLKIENDDMAGFRIMKDDLAFAHLIKEVSNNGFYLIEHNGERIIRQIKTLGSSKVLLVSNRGTVMTETVELKGLNIIAKLEKIEIQL